MNSRFPTYPSPASATSATRRARRAHRVAAPLLAAAVALALGAAPCATANAADVASGASSATNTLSTKQPYQTPASTQYSPAPAGYATDYTESVSRHGSRGLSSYKYDAQLELMGKAALADGGFVSDEVGAEFMKNVEAMTAANVENGYGQLTGQGADQQQEIGGRAYERNAALFQQAAADGESIAWQTSGEPRSTASGENFKIGFDAASGGILSGAYVTPADPTHVISSAAVFDKTPNTLYFHKTENPDGTEKTGEALTIAQTYQDAVDNDTTAQAAVDYIESREESQTYADTVLGQIFTQDFISKIGSEGYTWYTSQDGKKHKKTDADYDAQRLCAPGADCTADEDAYSDPSKGITSKVDAVMDLYNLYIIAADMQEESTGSHTFDFNQYFSSPDAQAAADWFAYVLDAEDFYDKGPGHAGQDATYSVAQPLLDDFFASIDARVAGGTTVATFRFAHAETIIPFAALLKLPGSTQQAPDVADPQSLTDVFLNTTDRANNEWLGSQVSPMAANIQWDVATKDGIDPQTGAAYTPLVRMLYNENEIAFNDSCTPVADGSTWYKETELKRCLAGVATDESPRIATASDAGDTPDASDTPDAPAPTGDAAASTTDDGTTSDAAAASDSGAADGAAGPAATTAGAKLGTTGVALTALLAVGAGCVALAVPALAAVRRRREDATMQ